MDIKDMYLLTESEKFVLEPGSEARVDIKLKKCPAPPDTKISGKVLSGGKPVSGATVKVLDRCFNPVTHATADEWGYYAIENLRPGCFKLTANAEGYIAARAIDIYLVPGGKRVINVNILPDPSSKKSFIYGIVTACGTGNPISRALVKLYTSSCMETYYNTLTNDSGQYLFCDIKPGEYYILSSKQGYHENSVTYLKVAEGQRMKVDMHLVPGHIAISGTVNGIIQYEGRAARGACVGLYSMDGGCETLIKTQLSNEDGLYLFTDVDQGIYIVKAKLHDGCLFQAGAVTEVK